MDIHALNRIGIDCGSGLCLVVEEGLCANCSKNREEGAFGEGMDMDMEMERDRERKGDHNWEEAVEDLATWQYTLEGLLDACCLYWVSLAYLMGGLEGEITLFSSLFSARRNLD